MRKIMRKKQCLSMSIMTTTLTNSDPAYDRYDVVIRAGA